MYSVLTHTHFTFGNALIPLFKYVLVVLSAADNGEGGTFALYSLLCRHAKFSLLPNQQAADGVLTPVISGTVMLKGVYLTIVFFNVVISSVSGLEAANSNLAQGEVRLISCVILVGLFALQHVGTHRTMFNYGRDLFSMARIPILLSTSDEVVALEAAVQIILRNRALPTSIGLLTRASGRRIISLLGMGNGPKSLARIFGNRDHIDIKKQEDHVVYQEKK
ncbi:hypothetical protein POM88_029119 [Heracleum sosnowskyi]|uniref:K+ potassium transporter integral membrane domain-containing protein n=1 Tax=Heracleum sosnowskyi TaxID=360622 RepID=A0AAD8HU51_9APIA|nr:hypothetical protein POM88_029119 [Heracleum sosnowskyi]